MSTEHVETIRYVNRLNPARVVEAVRLTPDNDRAVTAWAPTRYFVGGDHYRTSVMYGDWVFRDRGTGVFWVADPEAFEDDYVEEDR